MKYLKFKFNGKKPAKIVFLGDVHHGSIYSDSAAFDVTLEKIKKDKDIKIILMGDLIENASANSVGSGVYEQTMNPSKQVKDIVAKLKPFEKQILYSHRGNHEERSFRFDGFDIGETMADSLGVPYIRNMCICDVEVGKISYRIYTWHGHGSSQMTAGRVKILQRQAETVEADVYCFDKDTELLTQTGFKNYKDIKNNEKIYSLNLKTNKIEIDNITNLISYKSAKINKLTNKMINMELTDNHRVIYKYKNEWLVDSVKNIKNKKGQIKIPMSGIYNNIKTDKTTINEAKLIGWLISEGHFRKNQNLIQIVQKDTNNVNIINNLLISLKYKFSKNKRKDNTYVFNIFSKDSQYIRKNLINKKSIPKKCFNFSKQQFDAMLSTLLLGDGTKNGIASNIYYSSDSKLIDDIQILCTLNGYRTKKKSRKHGFSTNIQYELLITENETSTINLAKTNFKIKKYDDIVWCGSSINTTLIVRKNGRVFISGNCMGHVHELFDTTLPKREVVNEKFEDIFRHYILTGAYLKWDESYAEQNGYRMVKTGSPLLILDNKQKNSTVDLTWCK